MLCHSQLYTSLRRGLALINICHGVIHSDEGDGERDM